MLWWIFLVINGWMIKLLEYLVVKNADKKEKQEMIRSLKEIPLSAMIGAQPAHGCDPRSPSAI